MDVAPETWKQFERFMLTRLQYNPKTTIRDRIRKLIHLEKHGIDLINFIPEQSYDYFAKRIENGTKGYQLNHYIKSLNSWCKFRGINHTFITYRSYEKPIKTPTAQDINLILRSCDRSKTGKRTKAIIYLLANTGMRIGELCNLKLDDIDWNKNELIVIGKGQKTRIIPVKDYVLHGTQHPSLVNYIKNHRYKTHASYIFTQKSGKITEEQARKDIKTAARKAGMGWIHPHSFRHFYATNLLKHGIHVKIVQILLGHSNIKTTSRYLHAVEYDIRKAIQETTLDNVLYVEGASTDPMFFDNLDADSRRK